MSIGQNGRRNKFLTILLFYFITVLSYIVVVGGFGFLYFQTGSIALSSTPDDQLSLADGVYFSLLTFHSISHGNAVPIDLTGRILVAIELIAAFLFLGAFVALSVYFFTQKGDGLFLSRHVYVRHLNDRYYLSVRAGNRGPDVLDAKGSLELMYWRNKVRRRITSKAKTSAVLENVMSFDVDLSRKENSRLLRQLKTAIFMNNIVTMRFILTGIDASSGRPVSISRDYTQHNIRFGSRFVDLYQWKNGVKSRTRWRDFEIIKPISDDTQKKMKYYGESGRTKSSG